MSELYDPWDRLVRVVVLGKVLEVPENNLFLRQLAFVAPDIAMGRYCWNGECRYCEITCTRPDGGEMNALACRIRGFEGMKVTKAAAEIRYNLSGTLAAAPVEEP